MNLTVLTKDHFFRAEDYETFLPSKIESNSPEVLQERLNVKEKLLELHDDIYPLIKKAGWEIDKHYSPEHLTSGIDLNNPFIPNQINSIWLHYGKTESEIRKFKSIGEKEKETFINHARLQVIISGNLRSSQLIGVGTWLVIGKKDGGYWDRNNVRQGTRDPKFIQTLYNNILGLGSDYFLRINNVKRIANSFVDIQDFIDFVKTDRNSEYFIIGKDFVPEDPKLESDIIVQTIMDEFTRLYPIYNHIKCNIS